MSWFSKIAAKFEPDEQIQFAAIWANGKLYKNINHMYAIEDAQKDGSLYRDKETNHLESPDGYRHLDLFVTNKGQVIDRLTADKYFGISASENMSKQKLEQIE